MDFVMSKKWFSRAYLSARSLDWKVLIGKSKHQFSCDIAERSQVVKTSAFAYICTKIVKTHISLASA